MRRGGRQETNKLKRTDACQAAQTGNTTTVGLGDLTILQISCSLHAGKTL